MGVDESRSGEGMSTRERWYAGLVWWVFVPLEFWARVDAWLLCFWRLLVSAPVHEFPTGERLCGGDANALAEEDEDIF